MWHASRALLILALGLGLTLPLGAEGGRRPDGIVGAQTGRGAQAGRAGGGGGGGAANGAAGLFTYDPSTPAGPSQPDTPAAESHQKITLHGELVAYTTHAGFLALQNATTGAEEAHVFYTYYSRDGATDPATRPILFVVGGAPGQAAAWQDLGGLGPKRVHAPAGGTALPPYTVADNPDTVLDRADLVFVNPVGTAYSRADAPARSTSFWTTTGDAAALGEFTREFLGIYHRWNSPRVLCGADAETGRVAALALYLTEHQIPVSGLALLSTSIAPDATAGDAASLTLLPTETLAAWAHHKLPADLQALGADAVADQARQFAAREYLHALYQGNRIAAADRTKATADLARLTGLTPAVVAENDLRLPWDRFVTDLLGADHQTIAMSDTRVAAFETGGGRGGRGGRGGGVPAPAAPPADVAESRLADALYASTLTYLSQDLAVSGARGPFYLLNGGVSTYSVTSTDDQSIPALLARNPRLRILVALDDFDAGAPVGAADFTIAHWAISADARAHNLTVDHLAAGRDPYADPAVAPKLHDDLARLLADVTGGGRPAPHLH